jgi:hypothetical protein
LKILIDKSIYLFEKSVSFFHIIGSINVYYSVNSIVETHFSQNIENKLIQDFKGSLYQSHGTSNSRGGNLDKKECRVQISLCDFIIDFKLWTGLSNFFD